MNAVFQPGMVHLAPCDEVVALRAEIKSLQELINNPHTEEFLSAVQFEAAHQRYTFGEAEDRQKSAENWHWLLGKLAGKCLRAVILGDKEKALHHAVSSAAMLANWFQAIKNDESGSGLGLDDDLPSLETAEVDAVHVEMGSILSMSGGRINGY